MCVYIYVDVFCDILLVCQSKCDDWRNKTRTEAHQMCLRITEAVPWHSPHA